MRDGSKPKTENLQEDLREYFAVLNRPESSRGELETALFEALEKNSNSKDCFGLSHTWAESLIRGNTVSMNSFSRPPAIEIRRDPVWKKDQPDYKGIHVSHGAETYLVNSWTKGSEEEFPERTYSKLEDFDNSDALTDFLNTELAEKGIAMILVDYIGRNEGHAALVVKINGELIVLDNSMEPGVWTRSLSDFIEEYANRAFYAYVYPETIHS